jgi:hypothetical protein
VDIPPCEIPISRLSDAVPPYTASRPDVPPALTVKLPRPRLVMLTSNTSCPPLGPGISCELVLLLTNMRGGLLDWGAHKATDTESWEEDGREKMRVVEKLFPDRERGVSREREGRVLCARVKRRANNKASAHILAESVLARLPCQGRLSLLPKLMT